MPYIDYSQSENAARAKRSGRYPASLLVKRIKPYFRGLTTADVKAVFKPSEWHHTSCRYNATDFYDFLDLAEIENRRALRNAIAARKLNTEAEKKTIAGTVEWLEWSGSKRHPISTKRTFTGDITFKGRWAYFDNQKKLIDGKHFNFKTAK